MASGGNGDSLTPILSDDGRFVLFTSLANNLVGMGNGSPMPENFPGAVNVFLRDRSNGTTRLVSVNVDGTGGASGGNSTASQISTNGRYALFESSGTNLVTADNNNASDVFQRDMVSSSTRLVSVNSNGGIGNVASSNAVMTPDGRFVAFTSGANNLVLGDNNGIGDVFVRDMQTGVTRLVSTNAITSNTGFPSSLSDLPEITPDGRYVAFFSTATSLVPGVTNVGEIYLRDLAAGTTFMVSTNARAIATNSYGNTNILSNNHVLSTNGQYVAFKTGPAISASGIVFRYNRQTGATDIISTNGSGSTGNYYESGSVDMTPDGRLVAFTGNTNYPAG